MSDYATSKASEIAGVTVAERTRDTKAGISLASIQIKFRRDNGPSALKIAAVSPIQ
jgi:hypothetical protein